MLHVFAITARGLESVAAEEMTASGLRVEEIGYRRVRAVCQGPMEPLLELQTVDDLFLDAETWLGVDRPRSALDALREMSSRLDLYKIAAVCGDLRAIRRPPVFSVTASFVGRRNYTADEIKLAVADGITGSHYGWTYTPDDREADLNVRLFIEHETAYVGVRLAAEPLQNRPYKDAHIPGSLKPPVAAALAWLAGAHASGGPSSDSRSCLVDPCCGAGTILIEGARAGSHAVGGDISPDAVAATRINASHAGAAVSLHRWDAGALPVADRSVFRLATNPPWGRKITTEAKMAGFYARLGAEVDRVLAPGGRAVVLTSAPRLVRRWPLRVVRSIEISVYGQTPEVVVLERGEEVETEGRLVPKT